ncbi:mechanosensitive ion channel domain-containing protein [Halopseudomonas salegens]|nr:mechanosensitive ion channel domain-containing protein [Halopseudomonas salegens]
MLEPLAGVEVEVREGVVLLSGSVSNNVQAERALSLASQFPGVVTVDDGIERRLDVQGNLSPMLAKIQSDLNQWLRALPLVGLALLIFIVVVYLGYSLARWSRLWLRLTPNPFVAELAAQAVRIVAILVGLVVTLNLLGATALMATILGGAGVVGLAIGFAVRDTMENYISSIMLSLRQPFRANDHVVINEFEGKVVRLTSRATVLMTLDGNQLRIPNAMVFKGVILNYTRNPQRRFKFELGVASADNAVRAMSVGVDAMQSLPFVLKEPRARAIIASVGDSNTVLNFTGWINQHETDFGGARSLAIQTVTNTLDEQGFSMPEPIYRLRFDSPSTRQSLVDAATELPPGTEPSEGSKKQPGPSSTSRLHAEEVMDVSPDTHIDGMVNEERAIENETDLLDAKRPVE